MVCTSLAPLHGTLLVLGGSPPQATPSHPRIFPQGGITGSCGSLGLPLPEPLALGQQQDVKDSWNLGLVI